MSLAATEQQALTARKVGSQWLVEAESIDRQAARTTKDANGRPMSIRVAWAAALSVDEGSAVWLASPERSRLYQRLRTATQVEVLQRWMARRSTAKRRFRVGIGDIFRLLERPEVVATGISAARAHGLTLGDANSADAYVDPELAEVLVRDFYLLPSITGNLTLRLTSDRLHLQGSLPQQAPLFAPRMIVGADLIDDSEVRMRSAGRQLLLEVLEELKEG